mmetsp:Transcript_178540/g.572201  ORF Transcript_178540/g.572201 Transcript_178540/m.572201 type:complete len:208 (-) Transcript_178540:131-754(-)
MLVREALEVREIRSDFRQSVAASDSLCQLNVEPVRGQVLRMRQCDAHEEPFNSSELAAVVEGTRIDEPLRHLDGPGVGSEGPGGAAEGAPRELVAQQQLREQAARRLPLSCPELAERRGFDGRRRLELPDVEEGVTAGEPLPEALVEVGDGVATCPKVRSEPKFEHCAGPRGRPTRTGGDYRIHFCPLRRRRRHHSTQCARSRVPRM